MTISTLLCMNVLLCGLYIFMIYWSLSWIIEGRRCTTERYQYSVRRNLFEKTVEVSREGKAAENFGRIMTAFGYTLLLTTVVGAILQPAVIFPAFLMLAFLLEFVIGLFIYPMYPTDGSDN